jgi:hypothetical protein
MRVRARRSGGGDDAGREEGGGGVGGWLPNRCVCRQYPSSRLVVAELHRLERMEEDDLEAVRRKRLEMMKRNHKQKQEWLGEEGGLV